MRVVLTTNFDTLLEDAFEELNYPFKVIAVSMMGALPHQDTVNSLHCIVKLHGAYAETRADFSLDDPPNSEDKKRFAHFVWGGLPEQKEPLFLPSHLIVCGYSGRDMRCVQMIKYYLDSCPDGRVFWITYDRAGYDYLNLNVFSEEEYQERVTCTTSDRVDLLFNELYQQLRLCLPNGGFSYQFFPHIPPSDHPALVPTKEPSKKEEGKNEEARAVELQNRGGISEEEFHMLIDEVLLPDVESAGNPDEPRYVSVHFRSGVVAILRQVLSHSRSIGSNYTVWLETEDYLSPEHIAHDLLQIIAISIGRYQLDHFALAPLWPKDLIKKDPNKWLQNWERHCKMQFHVWKQQPREWLIVLYGRNSLGGCSGWLQQYWSGNLKFFNGLLATLAKIGFRLVYAGYTESRRDHERDKQEKILDPLIQNLKEKASFLPDEYETTFQLVNDKDKDAFPISSEGEEKAKKCDLDRKLELHRRAAAYGRVNNKEFESGKVKKGRFITTIEYAFNHWIDPAPCYRANRRLFLYACCLIRQSRQYSVFLTEATIVCPARFNAAGLDNDVERSKILAGYLKELQKHHVFEQKEGGFLWMYRDVRLGLLQLLETTSGRHKGEEGGLLKTGYRLLIDARARSHYWHADWYLRVFRTTGHAVPFFESLYHFAQAALHARFADRTHELNEARMSENSEEKDRRRFCYQIGLWKIALYRLIKTLRMGRSTLQFWTQEAVARLWFGKDNEEDMNAKTGGNVLLKALEAAFEEHYKRWETSNRNAIVCDDLKAYKILWFNIQRALEHEFTSCYCTSLGRPVFSGPPLEVTNIKDKQVPEIDIGFNSYESIEIFIDQDKLNECGIDYASALVDILEKKYLWIGIKGSHGRSWAEALTHMFKNALDGETARDIKKTGANINTAERESIYDVISPYGYLHAGWLEFLTEFAYALVRRGKILHHADDNSKRLNSDKLPIASATATCWLQLSVLCRFILNASAHLVPDDLAVEVRIRVRTLTYYGLALGRLCRFFEAHRRLNEANALLSKTTGLRDPVQMAEIELRRTELNLLEAHHLRWLRDKLQGNNDGDYERNVKAWSDFFKMHKDAADASSQTEPALSDRAKMQWIDLYLTGTTIAPSLDKLKEDPQERLERLRLARLDQAWTLLLNAERLLSGHSQSRLWWSRVHALQLHVFDEHAYKSGNEVLHYTIAFRDRCLVTDQVGQYFLRGVAAAPRDLFRYARLVDYLAGALCTAIKVDQRCQGPISENIDDDLFKNLMKFIRPAELEGEQPGFTMSFPKLCRRLTIAKLQTICSMVTSS